MAWIYLFVAGALEVVWAIGLKYSQGFTKFWASAITIVAVVIGFIFLSLALKTLPMGTGYAVWVGIGVVSTTLMGIILFNESWDFVRIFFILLILAGIIGLKLTSKH